MVESLQMFLFLFKSKYRRKSICISPFVCFAFIVLLFCIEALAKCSELSCLNGACKNDSCVCKEGWQGSECQYCGGKIKLSDPSGVISDGPGNYSVGVQCSWLIEPPWVTNNPPPIRIRLESFATECGWDHLYVYDGDSVRAPSLLAVFSGVLDGEEATWTRQVVARSGRALLHFFSDDAYAMAGFNVTYAAYSCPSDRAHTNCSQHGSCVDGSCVCESGWIGSSCDRLLCPEGCHNEEGWGACGAEGCQCARGRTGEDCTRRASEAGWDWLWREPGEGAASQSPPLNAPPPAAAYALVPHKGELLRIGGEMYTNAHFMYKLDLANKRWSVVEAKGDSPEPRFAHTAVLHAEKVYVYGGVVAKDDSEHGGGLAGREGRAGSYTNELWRFDLGTQRWANITPTQCHPHSNAPLGHCGGLHISGHSAVLVEIGRPARSVMLSFFGHSPKYGYLHIVQEYYIDEGYWTAAPTRGWPARGGFGHTAAWDAWSRRVYVHGGLVSESEATQAPSAALYMYEPERRAWRKMADAPAPRYLHSAAFVAPGVMAVFGGNAHNDSAAGSRCRCALPLLYDARCDAWRELSAPAHSERSAHAAAQIGARAVMVLGGFDGRLRSDALVLRAGEEPCAHRRGAAACVQSALRAARACLWRDVPANATCLPVEDFDWEATFEDPTLQACEKEPIPDESVCAAARSCGACAVSGCAWCGACYASAHSCHRHRHKMALTLEECDRDGMEAGESGVCARYHSCAACHAHPHAHTHAHDDGSRMCYWDYETAKCRIANTSDEMRSGCAAACSSFDSCANCTAEECIWCASTGRCIDKNAYGASFPLGGCRSWSTGGGGCASPHRGCGNMLSCRACRAEPACGWCDDGLGNGRGFCTAGGASGPHNTTACAPHNWHFTHCPPCQCNGHSVCWRGGGIGVGDARKGGVGEEGADIEGVTEGGVEEGGACVQPCGGFAAGERCETCAQGYWGSPLNGPSCMPCECNGQAASCAGDTGRCFCSTKGLAGDRCDKCDGANHYHADPLNRGACYYDLAVDYQFTFNLSKKEDRHLSAINFRNAPVKPDVDADFSIACSAHALMNLTVRTRASLVERPLFHSLNCTSFRYRFAKTEHTFGIEDNVTLTTFFVYVYDFKPPLWIQISFSQYPKLNLQQFFITFSSCFLLLLLVAAALWKIKQKYDMYRRRQRLFVEMEQMASRPFSQVCVELELSGAAGGVPAPVALEPCRGARAAVLSLLVRLPTGGTGRAPPLGGLAVASALVTLGNPQPPPPPAKRQHPHPRAL